MTGKMFSEKAGLYFISHFAYNLTFIPQFIAGHRGMPRRYHEYSQFEEMMIVFTVLSSLDCLCFGLVQFDSFFGER